MKFEKQIFVDLMPCAVECKMMKTENGGSWNTITDYAGSWRPAYFWKGIKPANGNKTIRHGSPFGYEGAEYYYTTIYMNRTFGGAYRVHLYNPWEPGEPLTGQLTLEVMTPKGSRVTTKDLSTMSKGEQYKDAATIEIIFWTGTDEDGNGKVDSYEQPLVTDTGQTTVHVTYEDGEHGVKSERFYTYSVYPTNDFLEAMMFWANWGAVIMSIANLILDLIPGAKAIKAAGGGRLLKGLITRSLSGAAKKAIAEGALKRMATQSIKIVLKRVLKKRVTRYLMSLAFYSAGFAIGFATNYAVTTIKNYLNQTNVIQYTSYTQPVLSHMM